MTRRKQAAPSYVNHVVLDNAGRRYRVCLSTGGTTLVVGRKCLPGGKARYLDPTGPKARMLVAKLKESLS